MALATEQQLIPSHMRAARSRFAAPGPGALRSSARAASWRSGACWRWARSNSCSVHNSENLKHAVWMTGAANSPSP